MTIRARLTLAFVAIAAVLATPALYGASRLARLSEIAAQQERHAQASLALGRVEVALSELDRLQRSYLVAPEPALEAWVGRLFTEMEGQLAVLAAGDYAATADDPVGRIAALRAAVADQHALVADGRLPEAARAFSASRELFVEAQGSLAAPAAAIEARRAADRAMAREVSTTATAWAVAGVALALLLALLIAAVTARSIARPINRLATAMSSVANGTFVVPWGLPLERRDEIGDLSRSFHWMTRRLAELDTMRSEFVAIASHELKHPIHVIGAYSEMLVGELGVRLEQRHQEFLRLIREQVTAATQLVNRLLDISRLEARQFTLSPEVVSLEHLFGAVTQWMGPEARRRQLRLRAEVDATAPATIVTDPDLLRSEVLGNLVGNALKFTAAGGEVVIRAVGSGSGVRIDVSDTGVGIPAEHLPYIFEKYYQAGRRSRASGSGLGLATARQAVEALGGTISVASNPGTGTIFSVTLPAEESGEGGIRAVGASGAGGAHFDAQEAGRRTANALRLLR
jgi:signal transduction histidine kinase